MKSALCFLATYAIGMTAAFVISLMPSEEHPLHTWIDDEPIQFDASKAYDADFMLRANFRIAFDNDYIPAIFTNTGDSVARIVTDRITGDQVFVINGGWRDGEAIKYRIIRNSRIDFYDYDNGWKKDKSRYANYWISEERRLEELQPIPSV
jgi:hypothetical protein